jgi:hypothetical protein
MTGNVGFSVVIESGTSVMGYVIREKAEEVKKEVRRGHHENRSQGCQEEPES